MEIQYLRENVIYLSISRVPLRNDNHRASHRDRTVYYWTAQFFSICYHNLQQNSWSFSSKNIAQIISTNMKQGHSETSDFFTFACLYLVLPKLFIGIHFNLSQVLDPLQALTANGIRTWLKIPNRSTPKEAGKLLWQTLISSTKPYITYYNIIYIYHTYHCILCVMKYILVLLQKYPTLLQKSEGWNQRYSQKSSAPQWSYFPKGHYG